MKFFYNTIFPTAKNSKLEELLTYIDSIYLSGYNPILDITTLPMLETLFVGGNTVLLPNQDKDDRNKYGDDIITLLYNNYVPKLKYVLVDRMYFENCRINFM